MLVVDTISTHITCSAVFVGFYISQFCAIKCYWDQIDLMEWLFESYPSKWKIKRLIIRESLILNLWQMTGNWRMWQVFMRSMVISSTLYTWNKIASIIVANYFKTYDESVLRHQFGIPSNFKLAITCNTTKAEKAHFLVHLEKITASFFALQNFCSSFCSVPRIKRPQFPSLPFEW